MQLSGTGKKPSSGQVKGRRVEGEIVVTVVVGSVELGCVVGCVVLVVVYDCPAKMTNLFYCILYNLVQPTRAWRFHPGWYAS